MNTPTAQIRTRRSSIVLRQSLKKAISENPAGDAPMTLEERKQAFDSHFPVTKPDLPTLAPVKDDKIGPNNPSPKLRRLARRSSVAITQNLESLSHAHGSRKKSIATSGNDSHCSEFHPEELKSRDFIEHLRKEFMVDSSHDGNILYSDQNILKRESLKFEKRIQFTLKRLWDLVDTDESGNISKVEYFELHRRLLKALVEGEVSEEEEEELANEDWAHDTNGHDDDIHVMIKQQFVSAFFRMVDVWTHDINVDEYATFLEDAFDRIAEPDGNGGFQYKSVNKVCFRGRRSSVVIQNGKLLALQLQELQAREKAAAEKKKAKKAKEEAAADRKKRQGAKGAEKDDPNGWWNRMHKAKGKWWSKLKNANAAVHGMAGGGKQQCTVLSVDPDRNMHVRQIDDGELTAEAAMPLSYIKFAENPNNSRSGVVYVEGRKGAPNIHLADVNRVDWNKFYRAVYSAHPNPYAFIADFRNSEFNNQMVASGSKQNGPLGLLGEKLRSLSVFSIAPKVAAGGKFDTSRNDYRPENVLSSVLTAINSYTGKDVRSSLSKVKTSPLGAVRVHKGRPNIKNLMPNSKERKKKKKRIKNWLQIGGTSLTSPTSRSSASLLSPVESRGSMPLAVSPIKHGGRARGATL